MIEINNILASDNKITSNFINNHDEDIKMMFIDSNNYVFYGIIKEGLNRSL